MRCPSEYRSSLKLDSLLSPTRISFTMAPDLNSLPPSRSSSTSSSLPRRSIPPASPGTASAGVNPSTNSPRPSRGSSIGRLSVSERRRSAAGMPPNLVETPGTGSGYNGETPGSAHRPSMGHAIRTASPTSHGGSPIFATADPHHQRAPSLGELHQELEQEQEAQVVGLAHPRHGDMHRANLVRGRTACYR